jgi:hypothetical protein
MIITARKPAMAILIRHPSQGDSPHSHLGKARAAIRSLLIEKGLVTAEEIYARSRNGSRRRRSMVPGSWPA